MSLTLTAKYNSSEELYARWQQLHSLRLHVSRLSRECVSQWESEADPDARARLWAEHEDLWAQYEVVSAWTEAYYSAYVFATRGCQAPLLNEHTIQMAQGV